MALAWAWASAKMTGVETNYPSRWRDGRGQHVGGGRLAKVDLLDAVVAGDLDDPQHGLEVAAPLHLLQQPVQLRVLRPRHQQHTEL